MYNVKIDGAIEILVFMAIKAFGSSEMTRFATRFFKINLPFE